MNSKRRRVQITELVRTLFLLPYLYCNLRGLNDFRLVILVDMSRTERISHEILC